MRQKYNMLTLIQTDPINFWNVTWVTSWPHTSEVVAVTWEGVGILGAYGAQWIINSDEDLIKACEQLATWQEPVDGII